MKGLVMEVRDGFAAVFREDGAVVKVRQSCQVGETIDLPELPQESARNAWQKVSALGAKISEFPSRFKREQPEPVPDTTELISGTVRETLEERKPVTPVDTGTGATDIISDTVRETLNARDTETEIMPGAFDDTSATEVTSAAAAESTFEIVPPQDSLSREEETEITSGTVWDTPDAPGDVTTVISDTVDTARKARKPKKDSHKTILFPAGLHVLDSIKDRVNAAKAPGDSETAPRKSGKKAWWNDSRFRGAIAAALAIVILSGSVTYNTAMACAYVSLDVDESSIEFSINRMGRVISVNAISSDAKGLAQSLQGDVKNKTVDDAVSHTMDVLKDAGYLDDADGEIIASVTSNTEKRSMELTQTVAQSVEGSKQHGVKLYLMEASRGDRGAALARQVSPGRYLIQRSDGPKPRPHLDTRAEAVPVSQTPDAPATPDTPDMSAVEGLPTATTEQPKNTLRPVLGADSAPGATTTSGAATVSGATTAPATATTTPATTTAPGTATTPTTTTPATGTTPATPDTGTTVAPARTPTTPKTDTGSTTKRNTTPATSSSTKNNTTRNNTDSGRTTAQPKPAPQPVQQPAPQPVSPEPVQPAPTVQPEPEPVTQPEPDEKPIAQPEPEPEPESRPSVQPEPEPEPESRPAPQPVEPEPESRPTPRHVEPEPEQLWGNDHQERKPANDGGETVAPKQEPAKPDSGEIYTPDGGETVKPASTPAKPAAEPSSPARPDDGETVAPKAPEPAKNSGGESRNEESSAPGPSEPANNGGGESSKPASNNETPQRSEPERNSGGESSKPANEPPKASEPANSGGGEHEAPANTGGEHEAPTPPPAPSNDGNGELFSPD